MMKVKLFMVFMLLLPCIYAQSVEKYVPEALKFTEGKFLPDIQNKSGTKGYAPNKNDTIRWSEGFEDLRFPPVGWAVYDPNLSSLQKWSRYTTAPIFGKGSASVRYESGNIPPKNDDWLVTPVFPVNSGDVLCFWAKGAASMFDDSLEVFYSLGDDVPPLDFIKITTQKISITELFRISLDFLAGRKARLGFHYKENNQYRVYLDSVYVSSSAKFDASVMSIDVNNDLASGIVRPKVKIKNNGYTKTPFSVRLTVNPGSYVSVKTVAGIAQYADTVVNFDYWNAAPGSYTISAKIILEGDENNDNDTLSKKVSVEKVLFDNGSFVNYPGSGPDGSDGSILIPPLNSFGYNNSVFNGYRVAEDFRVPEDTAWIIKNITFYGYQTGSDKSVSPFTGVNYRIWKGIPDAKGSVLVYGDKVTNKLVSAKWSEAYRYYQNSFSTIRPVFAVNASAGLTLGSGSYWIDWQFTSSAISWVPPVTINDKPVTGNALQFDGSWNNLGDSTLFVPGSFPQGLPFRIKGESYSTEVPVELTSFTGEFINGAVLLKWITATETNNSGFFVERKDEKSGFEIIAFLYGNGTAAKINHYEYKDEKIKSDSYTYRLKQVDYNGSCNYSGEISVAANIPASFTLGQNYPNPFNPNTNISFLLPDEAGVVLRVFNVLGQQVETITKNDLERGEHVINFNAAELNSGVYFYSLTAKTKEGRVFSSVKKMVLAK